MMDEHQQLVKAIAELEAQRGVLSDDVIDASVVTLREKLTTLEIPEQQRKIVTILYADIVGSTNIVKHLDPEDALEIMDGSLKRLAIPVEEHSGHIARFMGDGFKAVFGATVARENDPEMAIRAGLGILEVAQELGGELEKQWGIHDFQVRVGINTGKVAILGETEGEDTIMGEAVNLAKRVESAAPPGGLLITRSTYKLVKGVFDVLSHEPIEAKGFDEPIEVYLVLGIKPRAFPVPTREVGGIETRMVGRKAELMALQAAYQNAIEGQQTQVVTVVGEAGVGKSRLLYEFDDWIELLPDVLRFFQGGGRQETQNLPYTLLKDVFTFRFQIQESDEVNAVRKKIEDGFCEVLGADDEGQMRAHIIGEVLGFDFSESNHLKGIMDDPQQIHDRALMYLAEYFQGMSEQAPVVVFLEDIHWADDSSLDMINRLARRIPEQRLLIVCLARHRLYERRPHWGEGLATHRRLDLQPLSRHDSSQLVTEILQKVDQVPNALQELVVKGAEGNPFYIEELIKMLIEDGVILTGEEKWQVEPERLADIEVPDTLTGVLQARLEGLPPEERNTLQQASVVGHIFWDDTIDYISTESTTSDTQSALRSTDENLSSLRSRELIYHREESTFTDAAEYTFKHAVLRDVTYESVLKRLRRAYHGLVAEWLIQHSEERAGEYIGLIADHLELAGKDEQAAIYLYQAGKGAARRYANAEAVEYFFRALALTPEDDLNRRYDLLMAREKVFEITGDNQSQLGDLEALKEIAEILDDNDRRIEVALRTTKHFLSVSNFSEAIEAARYAVRLAEVNNNLELECVGYQLLGTALGKKDEYEEARDILVVGLELAHNISRSDLESDFSGSLGGVDISTGEYAEALIKLDHALSIIDKENDLPRECRIIQQLGLVSYYQGNYSKAEFYFDKALYLAREIGNRLNEVNALTNLANIKLFYGDLSSANEYYKQNLIIAREINNRESEAALLINLGYLAIQLGIYQEAHQYMSQGLTILREIDARSHESITLVNLGLIACNQNDYADAHKYSKQAFDLAHEIGYTDGKGFALFGIGDALIGLDRYDEAKDAYQESLILRQEMDQPHLVIESQEGLVRVAIKMRDNATAQQIIETLMSYLDKGNTLEGTESPNRIYLTCYQVLKANNDPRASTILEDGYNLLQERATKISDEELRQCFLNNVAVNREIVEEYEKSRLDGLETSSERRD